MSKMAKKKRKGKNKLYIKKKRNLIMLILQYQRESQLDPF
jgi:hypothetical protein